jgi:hypothetical protein
MLDGGIGCVRLNRRITPHGPLWFMSASSSPHADRGVPLAVTDQDYDAVIESIIDDGAVLCTVAGMLMSLPDGLLNLYRDYAGVPRLYLLVSEITREPRQDQPPPGLLRANAAVLFSTDAPGQRLALPTSTSYRAATATCRSGRSGCTTTSGTCTTAPS